MLVGIWVFCVRGGRRARATYAAVAWPPGDGRSAIDMASFPIGTCGQVWGDAEKEEWRASRKVQRSYREEVVDKLQQLDCTAFDVVQYGALEQDPERYPLFAVKLKDWKDGLPHLLITGGVHGYETSGVQGAILFLQTAATKYASKFNILVVPCVSPWGYETIQRWNCAAVDPNRSFNPDGEVVPGRSFNPEPSTDESRNLIAYLNTLGVEQWLCHIDQVVTTSQHIFANRCIPTLTTEPHCACKARNNRLRRDRVPSGQGGTGWERTYPRNHSRRLLSRGRRD